jgi:saccharopine dehydrogenase-like NADP-dependent oxidoreductase
MVDGAVDLAAEGGGFGVPYSAETILDEFTLPAMVFEDGEMRETPAGSGVVEWDFPEPVGTQSAMFTLHSEPATLPRTVPGVRDVRWRLALPHAAGVHVLVELGLVARSGDDPGQSVVPRRCRHGPERDDDRRRRAVGPGG